MSHLAEGAHPGHGGGSGQDPGFRVVAADLAAVADVLVGLEPAKDGDRLLGEEDAADCANGWIGKSFKGRRNEHRHDPGVGVHHQDDGFVREVERKEGLVQGSGLLIDVVARLEGFDRAAPLPGDRWRAVGAAVADHHDPVDRDSLALQTSIAPGRRASSLWAGTSATITGGSPE